jgi:GntR family transcriptional repressor for pyruvate dehydrogenase complex
VNYQNYNMSKFNLKPVTRKPSLADEVADALRQRLASGEFKPGDRLPTGAELASVFGVSLAVIREAMSRLKHDGIIDTVQGAGAFVTDTHGSKSFRLDHQIGDDVNALKRIFELRLVFEEGAARLAALRRTPGHLQQMRALLDEMQAAINEGRDGFSADKKFHELIAEATGNEMFREFFMFLSGRIANSIVAARSHSATVGISQEGQDEHMQLFLAIEAQDPDAAKAAMFNHVRRAARRLGLDIAGAEVT